MAFMTLFDFSASLSCKSCPRIEGTICQDTPNLSVSQPHGPFCPPSESLSHSSSISAWVSQFTKSDMPCANRNDGPPLSRPELLSGEPEGPGHERSLWAGSGVPIARRVEDLRVLENRGIEVDRFLGLIVERQKRGDFLHVSVLLTMSVATHPLEPPRQKRRGERGLPLGGHLLAQALLRFPDLARRIARCEFLRLVDLADLHLRVVERGALQPFDRLLFRLHQLLVELSHPGKDLLARENPRLRLFVCLDDHHEPHRSSLLSTITTNEGRRDRHSASDFFGPVWIRPLTVNHARDESGSLNHATQSWRRRPCLPA